MPQINKYLGRQVIRGQEVNRVVIGTPAAKEKPDDPREAPGASGTAEPKPPEASGACAPETVPKSED